MRLFLSDQTAVRHGVSTPGLLEQTIEEVPSVARQSPIEAEDEFVQVIVEVCLGNPPLVDAQEPPFQQGGTAMDSRQERRGGLPTRAHHPGPMNIPSSASLG